MNIRGAKHTRTSKNTESVQWKVQGGKVNTDGKKSALDNVMDELRNGWTYFECFELFGYYWHRAKNVLYQINVRKMILLENKCLPTWLISIALIYNYTTIKICFLIFVEDLLLHYFIKNIIILYYITLIYNIIISKTTTVERNKNKFELFAKIMM